MAKTAQISIMVERHLRTAVDALAEDFELKHGEAVREVLRAGLPVARRRLAAERARLRAGLPETNEAASDAVNA